MPTRPPRICPTCRTSHTGQCPHTTHHQPRNTAAQRGYDHHWQTNRRTYLAHHPTCTLCGQPSTVADHHPHTRRQLQALNTPDPDAWHRLRPLCKPCHDRHTARTTPGGWYQRWKQASHHQQHRDQSTPDTDDNWSAW